MKSNLWCMVVDTQIGFSSPAQIGIMNDIGMSLEEVIFYNRYYMMYPCLGEIYDHYYFSSLVHISCALSFQIAVIQFHIFYASKKKNILNKMVN